MVLRQHVQGSYRQAHAVTQGHALGHVVTVGTELDAGKTVFGMAEAVRDLGLADVVHQGANAQIQQFALGQAQGARNEQGNDAHIERVARRAVTAAGHQSDANLLCIQHAVQHRLGQALCAQRGVFGACAHHVKGFAPRLGGLCMLALAALVQFTLTLQILPPALGLQAGRVRARLGICRGHRGVAVLGQIALLWNPTQFTQAQAAQRCDLIFASNAKTRQGKWMRQPAAIQLDEHADAQLFHGDGARHSIP